MWGRFFPQALNVIAGWEKAVRALGSKAGLGMIAKRTTVYLARTVTFQRETEKLRHGAKKQASWEQKGGWQVPKSGVEGSPLSREG